MKFKMKELFDSISKRMVLDFEETSKALTHAGLKGASKEEKFREFLRKYFPRNLDVSKGQIIDSNGNISREIDVIVSDAFKTPIFYDVGGNRIIPVECVYSVIEVKSYLDTSAIEEIYQNMFSVRNLSKKAYYPPSGAIIHKHNLYGKEWNIWPVIYFVFAEDSIKLESLVEKLDELNQTNKLSPEKRVDSICILKKGIIVNRLPDGKFDALPTEDSQLFSSYTGNALLAFYAFIARYFNQVSMPNFRFLEYVKGMRF
jgi:hypothetical protein